ncbi:hypothetical protein PRZ48_008984 [Zasmidium cellare]|uniref:Uncharacterized protein n=1 Tax=Zasmidium cellare TaxID=395010 RepID=A0ABR0EGZ8_ZASCE|nr:hypothetical protein PRZ48_008984 [Zasmidium cellare]
MAHSTQVQAFTSSLYTQQLTSTSIAEPFFDNEEAWHISPITVTLGVPLKFRSHPGANHQAYMEEHLGCRKINKATQLLSTNYDTTSPDFGTSLLDEPITEDILVARVDGADLDVRVLRDVIEFIDFAVFGAVKVYFSFMEGEIEYDAMQRNLANCFSKQWAERSWEVWRSLDGGDWVALNLQLGVDSFSASLMLTDHLIAVCIQGLANVSRLQ